MGVAFYVIKLIRDGEITLLFLQNVSDKQLPVCICGNKVDLRREAELQGLTCVSTNHGELLAQEHNALFFETSSKIGTNINNALVTLSRYEVFFF